MRRILRYFMVLFLTFFAFEAFAQTQVWRDIYEAKKKDTIYGIAKKYDLTLEELIKANPEMNSASFKLKKGDKVFIPTGTTMLKSGDRMILFASTELMREAMDMFSGGSPRGEGGTE